MPTRQDYIDCILDHQQRPRSRGRLDPATLVASGGNRGCGDIVRIYARLGTDGRVEQASFEGEGCTISLAGASMVTEDLIGKTPREIIDMTFADVAGRMGSHVVTSRARCATLALSTAKRAADIYLTSLT